MLLQASQLVKRSLERLSIGAPRNLGNRLNGSGCCEMTLGQHHDLSRKRVQLPLYWNDSMFNTP
jgi:hypothetical protein